MTTRRRRLLLVVLVILTASFVHTACEYARGAAVIARAAGLTGFVGTFASLNARAFTVRPQQIPSRHGTLNIRLYLPEGASQAVVLVPGVHGAGIDEPRLVGFARALAADSIAVVTPDLIDLAKYQVTPRTTDMVEDTVQWVLREPALRGTRVGLMGISFGGGLSMVAAGRPAIRDHLTYVLSFGGYGDFARVLRYLCSGTLPDGSTFPPHDYGVVIILLGAAPRLVPAEQAAGLRAAILSFLEASHLAMTDKVKGDAEFARARELERGLSEPAATYMKWVNTRNVTALGTKLLPLVSALASDPALSPERSPAPAAPVFLLHGADDNVIPAAESELLATFLRENTQVQTLITPLITHAEIDRSAAPMDMWNLVAFWSEVLSK